LTAHSGGAPNKRFAVYRNNVVVSLVNALRSRFPAVEKIVGAEFFAAMARVFVGEHPPRSKILSEYGEDFAGFIASFPPAEHLHYLPDVARLEAARTRAYHAADATPIAADALTAFDPERLFALKIALHPSAQVVRSRYPIVTIWAMNSGELPLGPIDEDQAEDALVIRPQLEVLVRKLPAGGAEFLTGLATGIALGEAAQRAADADGDFDLAANLAGLIESGVMTGFLAEKD
jgi:hypothetical protein